MTDAPTVRDHLTGPPVRELRVRVVAKSGKGGVVVGRDDAITVGSAAGNSLVIGDRRVSRHHLEIYRNADRIGVRDLGSTNGTRIGPVLLEDAAISVESGTSVKIGGAEVVVENGDLVEGTTAGRTQVGGICGVSNGMRKIIDRVEGLGATDVSVLVVGESGTGKELVARALHEEGPRKQAPFVTVDCASIPQNLFESVIFGHVKGAFTGAHGNRRGAFASAEGGTLFLDEIGEIPPEQQASLLGVLERRRFQPVGSTKESSVDVRVVAATNRDLRAEVNRGTFRLDLYYRLAVVTLTIPPLRDRPEDVPALLGRLAAEEGHEGPIEDLFDVEEMSRLQLHRWPGNVRELRNVVLAKLATGEAVAIAATSIETASGDQIAADLSYREAKRRITEDFEKRFITELLARSDGNVMKASRMAKMNRSYLIELLHRHGLR